MYPRPAQSTRPAAGGGIFRSRDPSDHRKGAWKTPWEVGSGKNPENTVEHVAPRGKIFKVFICFYHLKTMR